jgi:long-chain fatty acid transport protein
MSRTLFFIFICMPFLLLPLPCSVLAQVLQRVEIPSSPNPVGSGARALGMGGAFIAVADDATAASWNPGGLIQLETPEISIVGAGFQRTEDNTFGLKPEASGEQGVYEANVNYFSLAYPFTLFKHNMIVSLNYQHLYDFTREWDFLLINESKNLLINRNIDYVQDGALTAIGLAYCIQVTPTLSLGFTLNIWDDWLGNNGWVQDIKETGPGLHKPTNQPLIYNSHTKDRYDFSGFNVNLGFLWNITGKITIGGVFKSPFTADLRHKATFSDSIVFPALPFANQSDSGCKITDEELDMPMSYGIGIAYRFSDEFTVSADIYRTQWQDFVFKDSEGYKTSPISGKLIKDSDIDPTHQVRVGAEYLFIDPKYVIPLRAGIFYDPAPAEGSPDDYYGFSLGSGISIGRFVFDIAYQYRFGRNVGESILQHLKFSQDIDEHTVYSSIIVHF